MMKNPDLPWTLRSRLRLRRIFWSIALAIILALLWWTNRPVPQTGSMLFAHDGDGFVLHAAQEHIRIRLLGIDAPELAQNCKTGEGAEWPCGIRARDALHQVARQTATLSCRSVGNDRFNRALSRCRLADGRDLAAELVAGGWALATSEDYLVEENMARRKKAGLWQGEFESPAAWRTSNPRR